MSRWMPRVYGNSPGSPISRAGSMPFRSSGPYRGAMGTPLIVVNDRSAVFMPFLSYNREVVAVGFRTPGTKKPAPKEPANDETEAEDRSPRIGPQSDLHRYDTGAARFVASGNRNSVSE